ncbi:SusC/RagA family TonB-linked outer membrane protein [Labilibacter marinus]|uniref:SusC/RagA family TonB-linked outer membrane protein n=1 Tax=Labilibacter marinus TaxID=1477105 RepID=UPI0008338690|nr:SusC/RagA family TonB-linked outer membrane protein [Labilibacter marinus]
MKKNKLYKLLFLGFLVIFCFASYAGAQKKGTDVTATIVDENGAPISGVSILASKGANTTTDAEGKFELTVSGNKAIVIEKEGYETQFLSIADLVGNISLTKTTFLASEKDIVKMGIATEYRRNMVGAVSSITPKEHLTYDNTQRVRDYIDGLLLGVKGSSNIRGLGNALFVIDGVIGRSPDLLNMEEVDQIAVLKDANAFALYGNQAKNGVIVINTKRGKVNDRQANVNIRYGIKQPVALPKYLGSADYMELFNEAKLNDAIRAGSDITGFIPPYAQEEIDNFRNSTNKYKYPSTDFYSDEYLRSFANTADIITEFSGGDEKTQYYINMGMRHEQSLVETNPDANVGTNRFNVRGNIDFRVNDWIKSSVDGVAVINTNKSALTNLLSAGTTFKPNSYTPLLPVSLVDTIGRPDLAGQIDAARTYDGMLLGGTQQFQNGPVANVIGGGYRKSTFRSTQFNNSIDFDLTGITEGLSARTYLSFDFYDSYNVSINNKYSVYEPTWENDSIIGLAKHGGPDQKDLTETVSTVDFTARYGFYGLLNYKKAINQNHFINTTFLGYVSSENTDGRIQEDNNAHLGLQVSYDYKKKLFADFSGAYVNSIKLPEGKRGGFSPTFGLGYILSEESFMKNVEFIDFLKLKASAGVVKSDLGIGSYYLYNETYADGGAFGWADGLSTNQSKNMSQGANPNMTYEERIDLNIGFESYFMKSLWIEFNYFKSDIDKQLTTFNTVYPSYYNTFRPMDNYNMDSYSGFELGMDYLKTFNDFSVKVGGNIMYAQSEVVKRDELYEDEYQNRTGKPRNAIFGLEDNGFYTESDFTTDADGKLILNDGLAVPTFGAVIPGDLKYVDQNNDDIIDSRDQAHIGQSGNPWSYGVNLRLKYKGLSLFVLGAGQFGGEANLSNNYYWVDGNDKYSEVVTGRWTSETANTATYPRLSAQKDGHNMQRSTFWMYNNSFFKIQRAQLTYEFSKDLCQKIRMKNLSVNVTGFNLLHVAENREIRELNIGGSPQYRTFMLGLRTSF